MEKEIFKFVCDDENCFFKKGDKVLDCYEVVDLLNALTKENEQLQEMNDRQREKLEAFYMANATKQAIKILRRDING